MDKFINILRNIRDVLYPEIVTMYNAIIGSNPLGLDGKVDKITGKGLSENDYTTTEKNKLAGIANNANNYAHPTTHPASIIDGSLYPSQFVKTDALGNTGFGHVNWSEITGKPANADNVEFITNKGVPNGYAPLGANGKIDPSFIGSLNTVDIFTPADEASMLLLSSAQAGDIAYRLDNFNSYMLIALPSSTLSNWKQLNLVGVTSINGSIGSVSLDTGSIPEGTNLYFTDERVDDRVAAVLTAGTNVSIVYNDALGTITISADDISVDWSQLQNKPATYPPSAHAHTVSELSDNSTLVRQDSNTGVAYLPDGTTAQRPVLPNGESGIRRNTETGKFEGGVGTTGATVWGSLGGGATGGGSDEVFILSSFAITQSFMIPAGKSAIMISDSNNEISFVAGTEITFASLSSKVVVF